jgi:hypothetical protein
MLHFQCEVRSIRASEEPCFPGASRQWKRGLSKAASPLAVAQMADLGRFFLLAPTADRFATINLQRLRPNKN